jgi:hypothetical protein
VTATFNANAAFATSSGTVAVTVNAASTTVSVASSDTSSTASQLITFTATVAVNAPGSGIPAGTIEFFDGSTLLGTGVLHAPLAGASLTGTLLAVGPEPAAAPNTAVATYTTTSLPLGTRSISARFVGATGFTAATAAPVTQAVVPDQVTVTVLPTTRASDGGPVLLSASVATQPPGTAAPVGTVSFYAGGTLLGTAPLVNGVATLEVDDLGEGVVDITAVFNPASPTFGTGQSEVTTVEADPGVGETRPDGTISGELPTTGVDLLFGPATFLVLFGLGLLALSGPRPRERRSRW